MPRAKPRQHQGLQVLVLGRERETETAPLIPPQTQGIRLLDLRGQEPDLRAIVEAASRSNVAVLVTGADKGLEPDTRTGAAIAALAGVRSFILAVDAGDGDVADAARIADEFAAFAEPLGIAAPVAIIRDWDMDARRSALLEALHAIETEPASADAPFRLMVDAVAAEEALALELSGTVVSGRADPGDEVVAAGTGRGARIVALRSGTDARRGWDSGDRVTLQLDRAIGAGPGEVLAAAGDRPETCDQFAARLLWLDAEPLFPGRAYRLRIGSREVPASVTRIKNRLGGLGVAPLAAGTLRADDRGRVNLSLASAVAFEPFERNRALGTFTLADRQSGRTVAAGTIDFALRRAANIHRQAVDVTKAARAAAKAQRPALLWFTGLSGAGKSTIANLVEKRLFALGHHTYLLDGDNVRHGLNRDLGFTAQDRVENIRRVAETAKLMVDAGLITLASFISPFRAERRLARDLLAEGEFIEVFVDASLGVAEARDPKGLYAQARAGRIPNFTGIDSPYEPPEAPELHLETDRRSADELADEVVAHLGRAGFLLREPDDKAF